MNSAFSPWSSPLAHLVALYEREMADQLLKVGVLTPLAARIGIPSGGRHEFRNGIINIAVYDPSIDRYFLKCSCAYLKTALQLWHPGEHEEADRAIASVLRERQSELLDAIGPVTSDVISLNRLTDESDRTQLDAWLQKIKQEPLSIAPDDLIQILPIRTFDLPANKTRFGAIQKTSLQRQKVSFESLALTTALDLIVNGAWFFNNGEWNELLIAAVTPNRRAAGKSVLRKAFYRWMIPVHFYSMPLALIEVGFQSKEDSLGRLAEEKFLNRISSVLNDIHVRARALAVELKNLRAQMAARWLDPRKIGDHESVGDKSCTKGLTLLLGPSVTLTQPKTLEREYSRFPILLHGQAHSAFYPKYDEGSSPEDVSALHDHLRVALNIAIGKPVANGDDGEIRPFDPERFGAQLERFRKEVTAGRKVNHSTLVTWLVLELSSYATRLGKANGDAWSMRLRQATNAYSVAAILNSVSEKPGNLPASTPTGGVAVHWSFDLIDSKEFLRANDQPPSHNANGFELIIVQHELISQGRTYNKVIAEKVANCRHLQKALNDVGLYCAIRRDGDQPSSILAGFGTDPVALGTTVKSIDLKRFRDFFVPKIKELRSP